MKPISPDLIKNRHIEEKKLISLQKERNKLQYKIDKCAAKIDPYKNGIRARILYIVRLYEKEFGIKEGGWRFFTKIEDLRNLKTTSRIVRVKIRIYSPPKIQAASFMFKGGKDTNSQIYLPIPTKWLYQDFEEEFLQKARMIKTFQ